MRHNRTMRTETREGKKNREPSAKIELQDHQAQKEVLCGEQYNTGAGVSSTDDEIFTESRGDRDSKSLPRMTKDRLEIPETLGWNASKPCESQPPSTALVNKNWTLGHEKSDTKVESLKTPSLTGP